MDRKPAEQVRYLSIPYPAGASREEATTAWIAAVRRMADSQGIDLGKLSGTATPADGTSGTRIRPTERVVVNPRTAPRPPRKPADPAALVDCMRQLQQWAGKPSLRELAKRAGEGNLPKSSVSDVFKRSHELPPLALLHHFVHACGGEFYWSRWLSAWQSLARHETKQGPAH